MAITSPGRYAQTTQAGNDERLLTPEELLLLIHEEEKMPLQAAECWELYRSELEFE